MKSVSLGGKKKCSMCEVVGVQTSKSKIKSS
jgi:hypothetical protein